VRPLKPAPFERAPGTGRSRGLQDLSLRPTCPSTESILLRRRESVPAR
jgi:hypothetical protein